MKNKEKYIPAPCDTTKIELPDELYPLIEAMARNVHEVWAASRIKEGWAWGPDRDDMKKTHPCLVPYEELPDSERDYDRNTSIETLKFILNSGFNIIPGTPTYR